MKFSTLSPGFVRFSISTRTKTQVQGENIETKLGGINVLWFAGNDLVEIGALNTPSWTPTSLNVSCSVGGLMPNTAQLSDSTQSFWIYSANEFKSYGRMNFKVPESLYKNVKNTCSDELVQILEVKDIVIYTQKLYISTNAGLFTLSDGSETWTVESTACIKKVVKNFQEKPF